MSHDVDPFKWSGEAFGDDVRRARYDKYARYAAGDQDLRFATPKYQQAFAELFRAFAYNRMGGVIDAHADRLQVERFIGKNKRVSKVAGDIWDRNRMDKRSGEVHREALQSGDAYVIVWPETGDIYGTEGGLFPHIWPQSASQVRVHYDDEQPGKITLAAKTWLLHDGRRRLNFYFPDRIEKYVTAQRASAVPKRNSGYLIHEVDGEPWPVPNPWGVVPVFHFANNAGTGEYGASELRDVIPLQDALNKVLTDLLLASEMGGFPQKVIIGLDSGDPVVQEGIRRLEGGLNKIFTIPMDPDGAAPRIDEFTATNLEQISQVVELFDKLISRASRVPIHYLQMSGGFPSGRALRTADAPFVSKIEDRMVEMGNSWEDAVHLALRQAGVADPGDLSTVWKSAAPLSQEDQWDLAMAKRTVGLPLPQILREQGYDDPTIDKIMEEEQARAAAMFERREIAMARGDEDPPGTDDDDD